MSTSLNSHMQRVYVLYCWARGGPVHWLFSGKDIWGSCLFTVGIQCLYKCFMCILTPIDYTRTQEHQCSEQTVEIDPTQIRQFQSDSHRLSHDWWSDSPWTACLLHSLFHTRLSRKLSGRAQGMELRTYIQHLLYIFVSHCSLPLATMKRCQFN